MRCFLLGNTPIPTVCLCEYTVVFNENLKKVKTPLSFKDENLQMDIQNS